MVPRTGRSPRLPPGYPPIGGNLSAGAQVLSVRRQYRYAFIAGFRSSCRLGGGERSERHRILRPMVGSGEIARDTMLLVLRTHAFGAKLAEEKIFS